jgi:hypothetical protein
MHHEVGHRGGPTTPGVRVRAQRTRRRDRAPSIRAIEAVVAGPTSATRLQLGTAFEPRAWPKDAARAEDAGKANRAEDFPSVCEQDTHSLPTVLVSRHRGWSRMHLVNRDPEPSLDIQRHRTNMLVLLGDSDALSPSVRQKAPSIGRKGAGEPAEVTESRALIEERRSFFLLPSSVIRWAR